MSENQNKLRIHTQLPPDQSAGETPAGKLHWKSVPHPKNRGRRLSFSDRLLRNSALACALLLAILAMGNVNQPWARRTSRTIEQALTMHIDLDESIGRLSFVRNLVPESALVFMNMVPGAELAMPVNGGIIHEYSEVQPWMMFSCPAGSEVVSAADGIVTAVSELPDNATGILIDHGNGLESVCACLSEAAVQPGDTVMKSQPIGTSGDTVYFELRENELPVDPSERMGL